MWNAHCVFSNFWEHFECTKNTNIYFVYRRLVGDLKTQIGTLVVCVNIFLRTHNLQFVLLECSNIKRSRWSRENYTHTHIGKARFSQLAWGCQVNSEGDVSMGIWYRTVSKNTKKLMEQGPFTCQNNTRSRER